jgi:hypothetical protein
MAIVAEGQRGRVYLSANDEQAAIAAQAIPYDVQKRTYRNRRLVSGSSFMV